MEVIPACDRRKSVMEWNFNNQSLQTETTLGVLWNIEEDVFIHSKWAWRKNQRQEEACSQNSVVHMILLGLLHQHLCEENLQWDEIVPQSLQDNREDWKRNR